MASASAGLLEDVLLIALLDTGVPVWALDARLARRSARHPRERARASGSGARADAPALPAGGSSSPTPRRRLRSCSASSRRGHEPRAGSDRVMLFAVQVAGVPALYVEEALWSACSAEQL